MASTSTLGPVSSSTRRIYDVFLSFYGKDTRNNFVDHLHAALKRKGIISFRDDEKLERGEVIFEELMQAIQDSEYAIVVISANYAFSKWCLNELAEIMKCKSETGLKVLPIFYNVDPSDVRKQKNSFERAFVEHEKEPKVSEKQIKTWKNALNDMGNLSGWHINNSPESAFIESISQKILKEWRHGSPNRFDGLIGIGSRVEEIISLLRMGLEDFRIIGIYGLGGIGKTTLARVVYDQISPQFEARCFVANIREETKNHGLIHLQTQIISKILQESEIKIYNTYDGIEVIERRVRNKNVFIVLDDVDSEDQLKVLARSREWFSPGSRVILTTRDHHLLEQYKDVNEIFELKELSKDESLELFCRKAFKKDHPAENYMELSKDIVGYAQGLPLALEVFGSHLYGKSLAAWKAAREKFKVDLDPTIYKKLKISYDGLTDSEKELFLDIACLYNGQCNSNEVGKLKALHPYFGYDIEILKDQCLIKGSKEYFHMHDLLQEMGQQIVRQESLDEPGKRSRLSSFDCIGHISKHDSATDTIEKIVLKPPSGEVIQLCFEIFSKMTKLKMLEIGSPEDRDWGLHWHGDASIWQGNEFCFSQWVADPLQSVLTNFQPKNKYFWLGCHGGSLRWYGDASKFVLSNELLFFHWSGYPLQSLPTNFQPKNLVELRMPYNCIKGQWGGWKDFDKLKHIDLSYSANLVEISDLSGIPKLKILNLRNCRKLSKVHKSLEFLKRLKILRMGGCQSLERLPDVKSLESFRKLDFARCPRLKTFPNIEGDMTSLGLDKLKHIDLSYSANLVEISDLSGIPNLRILNLHNCRKLRKVHISLGFLKRLWALRMDGCQSLERLPDVISLESLLVLNLAGCSRLKTFPNIEGDMTSLKLLDLTGTMIRMLPSSSERLSSLKYLNFCGSLRCQNPPEYFFVFEKLYPYDSWNYYDFLELDQYSECYISWFNCKQSFWNRRALDVEGNGSSSPWFFIPDVSSNPLMFLVPNSSSLRELDLSYLNMLDAAFPDLSSLSSIKILNLSGNKLTTIPSSICQLSNLFGLYLRDCKSLQSLESLPCLRSLRKLNLAYCNLSNGMIPDNLGFLSSLMHLSLSGNKFRKIPDLVQLSKLLYLYLDDCAELQVLPKLPLQLWVLRLSDCPLLEICYHEMDPSTSSERLTSDNFSFTAVHFDSDGRPYQIPHLHPSKVKDIYYHVMVGIAQASRIPYYFNRITTGSFETIEHFVQSNGSYWQGFALLILYEVHEHGSSNNGISDGGTHTLPQFVCQFQFNKIGLKESLSFCAPEVPLVGLNGLWVFISRSWLGSRHSIRELCYLGALIESCSLNVEVREFRARCVYGKDLSEFSKAISSISPHALNLKDFHPLTIKA